MLILEDDSSRPKDLTGDNPLMKTILSIMLGLALIAGAATTSFAAQEEKTEKKKKKKKKTADETKK
ncbi:MAG TPA: hypothetical protein VM120_08185, partial [Bryobacteraceae bacterium]|nr:hypothetical protein [Bryobacteraceae bacterium]